MESDREYQDQEQEIEDFVELTPEFKNNRFCQPCSIIELISLFQNDEKNGAKPLDDNNIVKATKDYVYTFNKYGFSENVTTKAYNTRRIFTNGKENDEGKAQLEEFSPIEQTFLVDLVPSNAEEAFSLIPSLKKKFSPEIMQELLDQLNNEVVTN